MKSNKIIRYVLIFAVIVIIALVTSNIQSKKEYNALNQQTLQKITSLDDSIASLQTDLETANTQEKNDNTAVLTKLNNLSNNISNEIQALTKGQGDINTKIMQIQSDISTLKTLTAELATPTTGAVNGQ